MDKRGFIRTLEAVLAVLIVVIFVFTIAQQSTYINERQMRAMRGIEEGILRGILQNDNMRSCIVGTANEDLDGDRVNDLVEIGEGTRCSDVKDFVEDSLPKRFQTSYNLQVCEFERCSLPVLPDKNVYTSGAVVSSVLNEENRNYNPRIIRLWIWG